MKIIVYRSTGEPQEYEASNWTVNENGVLKIFESYIRVFGAHAPGTWDYVREVEE